VSGNKNTSILSSHKFEDKPKSVIDPNDDTQVSERSIESSERSFTNNELGLDHGINSESDNTVEIINTNIEAKQNKPIVVAVSSDSSPVSSPSELLHKRLGAIDISSIQIEHTPEWDKALELMESNAKYIYITGEAGTGKSTLLRYFVSKSQKSIVILAPTGIAAINVGGQTIHSFFKFPPRPDITIIKLPELSGLIKVINTIIIDEISMVRADLLDSVDKSLRVQCNTIDLPFGGKQMIFIGDLFQLPPVVTEQEEGQYFSQYYRSPFFFDAHTFKHVKIDMIKLNKIYRQIDPKFMGILNDIRINRISDDDLSYINQRVNPTFDPHHNDGYIELTTTNRSADFKNNTELMKMPEPEYQYVGEIVGKYNPKQCPTDLILKLRIGAQVMLVKNDINKRWVNGTIAYIDSLDKENIVIRIPASPGQPDRICDAHKVTWEINEYNINHTTQQLESNIVGTFTQYPIKLAWSITIHKGQGKTLDKVIIDLSGGTFAHGQAYVALSRCSSLEGLILRSPIKKKDILVDPRVFGFMDAISDSSVIVH
jgi:ATP-dependent exoDNAse (exonuclease V) alpha subunit